MIDMPPTNEQYQDFKRMAKKEEVSDLLDTVYGMEHVTAEAIIDLMVKRKKELSEPTKQT